jgi:aspartate/methionine/tyrosine aminotransferase
MFHTMMVTARTAGAFYAFPNISALGVEADDLAVLLLEDVGVAVVSGQRLRPSRQRAPAAFLRELTRELDRALERIRR